MLDVHAFHAREDAEMLVLLMLFLFFYFYSYYGVLFLSFPTLSISSLKTTVCDNCPHHNQGVNCIDRFHYSAASPSISERLLSIARRESRKGKIKRQRPPAINGYKETGVKENKRKEKTKTQAIHGDIFFFFFMA